MLKKISRILKEVKNQQNEKTIIFKHKRSTLTSIKNFYNTMIPTFFYFIKYIR